MVSFYTVSTQVLEQDHREMISLMNRIAYSIKEYLPWCSEEEIRQSAFDDNFKKFKSLFERHTDLEEKRVYPLLRSEPQCQFAILRAKQAHHMARLTLAELRALPYTHEVWGAKFLVLRDLVTATIREEEDAILPWLTEHASTEAEAFCA